VSVRRELAESFTFPTGRREADEVRRTTRMKVATLRTRILSREFYLCRGLYKVRRIGPSVFGSKSERDL